MFHLVLIHKENLKRHRFTHHDFTLLNISWFHSVSDFTQYQISPNFRFHPLVHHRSPLQNSTADQPIINIFSRNRSAYETIVICSKGWNCDLWNGAILGSLCELKQGEMVAFHLFNVYLFFLFSFSFWWRVKYSHIKWHVSCPVRH